jgi:polysaccharide export outer membrane protein
LIAQSAPADAAAVPLEPGDAIRLAFWREPALSGEYPVDAHGSVVLPYVGERTVTGIAPATLRAELLEEYTNVLANQAVQVSLLRRVRVLGAVRSPGLYRVDATMTIADALALAGGLTPDGRLDGVRIVRGGDVIPVDLTSDAPVGSLHSGDQITVRESGWLARNSAALLGATISALGFLIGQAVF